MNSVHYLVGRDTSSSTLTPTMVDLMIALVVLVVVAFLSVIALIFLRKARKAKKASAGLPVYEGERPTSRMSSHHRSLTISTAPAYPGNRGSSIYVYDEKKNLMNEPGSPESPIPEIRITFPEEVDDKGNRQSGRVVVVRVGEHSVGLEPLHEEQLPPYQKDASDRFQSLDLERIGGLKEKNEYSP